MTNQNACINVAQHCYEWVDRVFQECARNPRHSFYENQSSNIIVLSGALKQLTDRMTTFYKAFPSSHQSQQVLQGLQSLNAKLNNSLGSMIQTWKTADSEEEDKVKVQFVETFWCNNKAAQQQRQQKREKKEEEEEESYIVEHLETLFVEQKWNDATNYFVFGWLATSDPTVRATILTDVGEQIAKTFANIPRTQQLQFEWNAHEDEDGEDDLDEEVDEQDDDQEVYDENEQNGIDITEEDEYEDVNEDVNTKRRKIDNNNNNNNEVVDAAVTESCQNWVYLVTHYVLLLTRYGTQLDYMTELNEDLRKQLIDCFQQWFDELDFEEEKEEDNRELALEIGLCWLLLHQHEKKTVPATLVTYIERMIQELFQSATDEAKQNNALFLPAYTFETDDQRWMMTYHLNYLLASLVLTAVYVEMRQDFATMPIVNLDRNHKDWNHALPTATNNTNNMSNMDLLKEHGCLLLQNILPAELLRTLREDVLKNKLFTPNNTRKANNKPSSSLVRLTPFCAIEGYCRQDKTSVDCLKTIAFNLVGHTEFTQRLSAILNNKPVHFLENEHYIRCKQPGDATVPHVDYFYYVDNGGLFDKYNTCNEASLQANLLNKPKEEKQICQEMINRKHAICGECHLATEKKREGDAEGGEGGVDENENERAVVYCDVCEQAFHTTCLKEIMELPSCEWHCDKCANHRYMEAFTIWIPLQESTKPEQGMLALMPKTHETMKGLDSEHRIQQLPCDFFRSDNQLVREWFVPKEMKLGDAIIFNMKTVHAATVNQDATKQPRLSIDLRIVTEL